MNNERSETETRNLESVKVGFEMLSAHGRDAFMTVLASEVGFRRSRCPI
jgi:hypothetical protein